MQHDFGNQYAYFSEDIDEQLTEILLDELNINVSVDSNHRHNKVTEISITGFFWWYDQHPKNGHQKARPRYKPLAPQKIKLWSLANIILGSTLPTMLWR